MFFPKSEFSKVITTFNISHYGPFSMKWSKIRSLMTASRAGADTLPLTMKTFTSEERQHGEFPLPNQTTP